MQHEGDAGRVYRGYNHDYTTLNISSNAVLSDAMDFNASAGLRVYDRNWQESKFDKAKNVDVLNANNGAYQRIIPVDVNITYKHGNNSLLTFGADYQNAEYHNHSDPLKGYKTYGTKSRANQKSIYIQEEFGLDQLTLRGGLRYNYITTKIDLISSGVKTTKSKGKLLWSAGAKYNMNTISLFANAGNSFMTPGLKSLGGTIKEGSNQNGQIPSLNLKPESGLGFDVGVQTRLFDNSLKLGARAFFINIIDAIVDIAVSKNPSQSKSINAEGKTQSNGFEIEVDHRVNNEFSWFANYTYMKPEIKDKENSTVPFAPNSVANLGLSYDSDFGLKITPILNYTGTYYDSNVTTGKEFTPGVLLNLFVSQTVVEKKDLSLDLFLKTYNLTDNTFEMPWQFQNTGFALTGGFIINFK